MYLSIFAVAHDTRPVMGCYQDSNPSYLSVDHVATPSLDALAKEGGVVFENAFANVPFGDPSKASLLTSRRPSSLCMYDNLHKLRDFAGNEDIITLPEYFKMNGYKSLSFGPIFHPDDPDLVSWSEEPYVPKWYPIDPK